MKNQDKSGLLWIIAIILLLLLFLFIINIASDPSTGASIKTSSSRDDGFLKTTHTETRYGLFGKETISKDCPFWNRDC